MSEPEGERSVAAAAAVVGDRECGEQRAPDDGLARFEGRAPAND